MPPLIDSDVHHNWKSDADIVAYLPKRWREIVGGSNGARGSLMPPTIWPPGQYGTNVRLDTFAEDGSRPGSDYPTLKRQWLDPFNIRKAILSFNIGLNGGLANPQLAREVVIAANNWNRDHWLSIDDDRIASVIMVSMQEPEEAAKEIRRVAGHPKLVEVLLVANAIGRPFGHPIYHPIYEAAAEVGLPIGIHAGGDNGGMLQTAGGLPNSRLEMHVTLGQAMLHHAASFITHGVFEKFPSLRLLLIEIGVSWAPWLIWSLDAMYPVLRQESIWVKRLPSEYFRQHIRMTTQPLEMSPKRDQLVNLLDAVEGIEDMLCFASDYPHWDTDDPTFAARLLPDRWHAKLFYNNAAKLYGWPELPAETFAPIAQPIAVPSIAAAVAK
jgi:predicted TIM-barrel fold metal-dependent hydrolase